MKPVRENIRIDCRLASRRLSGVACLVGVNLAELRKRRIAHHERHAAVPVLDRAPVADRAVGVGRHRMAVFIRADDGAVQVRYERAARHRERERQISIAIVAACVEQVPSMFKRVLYVYALRVVREADAARHLRTKRIFGVRLPSLVVVACVEELVCRAVDQLAFQLLVVDGVDYAVCDDNAIPAVFGSSV